MFEFIKTLLIILVTMQVMFFLLKRSYVGKIIILSFKIIRDMLRFNYNCLNSVHRHIRKSLNKNQKHQRQTVKKVVNGDNVVDFTKYSKRKK